MLPKAEKKKFNSKEEFVKLAEKVKKGFEEQADYLEKKMKDENYTSTHTHSLS